MLEKKKGYIAQAMVNECWPIKNKIPQYKALIKFTAREKIIQEHQNASQQEDNKNTIIELQKDIKWFRNIFANSLIGPKQEINNILREHRTLKLAYQSYGSQMIVEALWQITCTKKKMLDQLVYLRKKRMTVFTAYQVNKLEFEENLEFYSSKLISYDEQTLTNNIHQMQVKRNAAALINKTYTMARDVLKRDAVYFNTVLDALQANAEEQMMYIIRTTKMGQFATEQYANIEEEYKHLEKVVRSNMKERVLKVKGLARDAQILQNSYLGLVRTEKEVDLRKSVQATDSEVLLNKELYELQEIISLIKNTTHVSMSSDIFNRFKAQIPQKDHLVETVLRMEKHCNIMLNQKNHAQIIAYSLENKLIDTTKEYKEKKACLLQDIAKEEEEIKKHKEELVETGKLMTTLRTSLQTLLDIMENVQEDKLQHLKAKVQPIMEDAHVIMKLARMKLSTLINLVPPEKEPDQQTVDKAKTTFQKSIAEKITRAEYETEEEVDFLMDVQEADDPEVITRADIILRSKRIVAQNAVPAYLRK